MPPSFATSGGIAAVPSKLNKSILALAIPAIVANITTPLLSMVDLAIVGHLGSAAFVAAIAVGGTVCNMLYWLFGFLRFGTSGLTAQAFGAKSPEAATTGIRSMLIALVLGGLIVAFHIPLIRLALDIMDPEAESATLAASYLRIVLFGAPAVLLQYSLTGWFVGRQDTRTPMLIALVINVVNIVASLLLVYCLHLDICGVASGTLFSQWVGAILGFILALRGGISSGTESWRQIFDSQKLKRFFAINADIFLRTLCLIGVTLWFTRTGARQGDVMLAVNTLLLQFFTLFSYFMDGFAFAAEALCGKCVGAKDLAGLKRCMKAIMRWGLAIALVATAIYGLGGEAFLRLLTSEVHVIHAAEPYRLWAVAIPIAGFMAFTADGIAIGITHTRAMLASMAAATLIYFALYFVLRHALGNHALWLAFTTYLLVRGIALTAIIKHTTKRAAQ